MVLANSDDLTLASASTGKHNNDSPLSKDHSSKQQRSPVKQFRATIDRALRTHLQMTTKTASTFSCCGNCCTTTSCCGNSGVDSMTIVNDCWNSNNITDNSQQENGDVENHEHLQAMDNSSIVGGTMSTMVNSIPTVTIGLVK